MAKAANFFRKYNGLVKNFKPGYYLYNLLHAEVLWHNRELYQKYGIEKSIFSPISSADFRHLPADLPWIDQPDASKLAENREGWEALLPEEKRSVLYFIEKGYLVIRNFYSAEIVEAILREVNGLITEGKITYNFTERKALFAIRFSTLLSSVATDPRLIRILSFLLGRQVFPFQSINFETGSEQRPHSDYIHMATYPVGLLIAAWIALENVTTENGPLFYYSGSHRLPYLRNEDFPHGGNSWFVGRNANARYEEEIERRIQQNALEKEIFAAEAGDLLIWHGNLIHGGLAIQKKGSTRRSMVLHYFGEGAICYHELTQRPALIR